MDLVRHFEEQQTKTVDRPHMRAGDVVRVGMKVQEGEKSRLQTFEGTVLGLRGSGPSATLTVRRETGNFGVERIFPLYSPLISSIDIVKRQKVRRAKLSYLRQAGRRRFKEDVESMQSYVKEQADKKRLTELAEKKVQDAQEAEKKKKEKAEAEKKAKESADEIKSKEDDAAAPEAAQEIKAESKPAENTEQETPSENKDKASE